MLFQFFCVNALLHFEEACGFFPVWNNFICFQMCLLCECLVTFLAGMKIFTSINLWVFKLPTRENVLAHYQQTLSFSHNTEYGFTPVWNNPCLSKVPYCVNVLSHFEQPCAFLPVRISSCVFKYAFCVNVFSHFEQTCGFSLVWITSCFFKKQQKT